MNTIEELQKVVDELLEYSKTTYDTNIADWKESLQSIIDRMKAQEPVAWVVFTEIDGITHPLTVYATKPDWDMKDKNVKPVYAAPPVPEGMVKLLEDDVSVHGKALTKTTFHEDGSIRIERIDPRDMRIAAAEKQE